jgi:hypothetical protein
MQQQGVVKERAAGGSEGEGSTKSLKEAGLRTNEKRAETY